MSGASDSNIDADKAIRLVSINADALLKTSATARSVLEGPWQKPGSTGSPNACARSSNCLSAVRSPDASLYSSSAAASMTIGHTMSLPVVSQSEMRSTAVTGATPLSSTVSVSVERIAQEIQLDCVTVTSSDQSFVLVGDQEPSNPLLTQSNDTVKSDKSHIAAGIIDIPVTDEPSIAMHTVPQAVSGLSLSKNLSATAVSEEPELREKNRPVNENDSLSSCSSQTTVWRCPLDASKTDVVTASNDFSDGKLSFTTQRTECSIDGTSNQTDQMEAENYSIDISTSDQLLKTTGSSETENDQWAESADAKMELKPTHNLSANREQNASIKKIAVLRKDTENSVSRKPSRIVSFTTEDFDLFQSKYIAVYIFHLAFYSHL